MFEYRVTKYNPRNRDMTGRYLVDEWTSSSQIGQEFAGRVLTEDDYQRVEDAYINVALAMLGECGVETLAIRGLENSSGCKVASFDLREGVWLAGNALHDALRGLLRENFWCRLEGIGEEYIHVGWDYYLYIGIPCVVSESVASFAESVGLFIEAFESPYKT